MLIRILYICIPLFLTRCVPILCIGTGALTGSYIAGRDKNVSQSISDTKIDAKIKAKLHKNAGLDNVSVITDNGCVLLTGYVSSDDLASKAEKIAWTIEGVKIIDNNITIGEASLFQSMKDSYITSSCRGQLLATKDIKSLNIKIKTKDNVVYLSGNVRSQKELNKILGVVKNVNNVKKVISYINISND